MLSTVIDSHKSFNLCVCTARRLVCLDEKLYARCVVVLILGQLMVTLCHDNKKTNYLLQKHMWFNFKKRISVRPNEYHEL